MTNAPHGSKLTQVKEVSKDSAELTGFAKNQRIKIGDEARILIANIASGVLSPIDGFMSESDYSSVLDQMRLETDVPWTIPVLLLSDEQFKASPGDEMVLTDRSTGDPVAVLDYQGSFTIAKKEYAMKVFQTEESAHPGVARIYSGPEKAIAGRLKVAAKPDYGPASDSTLSPRETRVLFAEKGWKKIVAFQTRNAPHINHEYTQKSALALVDGLFINPVLGKKKAGDFKDEVILATYQKLIQEYYPKSSVVLSSLHYEMQYAGPKEAIMHAIMRKNFGCTHIIIGRDHAGVGNYYGPYAAQDIFTEFPDLGITPFFFREFYYCKRCGGIASERTCPHPEADRLNFSGTVVRNMFLSGETPPKEFMRPEVSRTIKGFEKPFVE